MISSTQIGHQLWQELDARRARHEWKTEDNRIKVGLTSGQLEQLSGVPAATIRAWNAKQCIPPESWDRAAKCLAVLGVSALIKLDFVTVSADGAA
jgi:hypothetical protein